jgi:ABC-2 type transport system ATP-binding protein
MRVERGEVFGFLGPNGAGKTTAVKLFLGLAAPSDGDGTLLGAPLGDREARRRVGYLPELFRYQPWLRAREVLALHCALAGIPEPGRRVEIEDALDTVGLTDRSEDLVGTFSKGMQQRLGLGAALLGDPELVLLDEPTSALDPVGRADVRRIIRAARDRGTTVFLNSHLLSEVELVCDRVAVIDGGRVIAAGTLEELLGDDSVRIRVDGLPISERQDLGRFGSLTDDGDWLSIRPIAAERIPEVVAAIVAAGGRVHAVEPGRASLEERFLGLFGSGSSRADDSPASPATRATPAADQADDR